VTHQLTDRELINVLSDAAFRTGHQYQRWVQQPHGVTRNREHLDTIERRTELENAAVERLIVRDEKIKRLQAEIADLKRERELWGEMAVAQ
jgi:hypothetical protein